MSLPQCQRFPVGRLFLNINVFVYLTLPAMAVEIDGVDVQALSASLDTAPKGEYVEAIVPDTLDLAERGGLAINALTTFLNADKDYAPYGQNYLNANPPYFGHCTQMGRPNWGKLIEGLMMARQMSGSRDNLEIDRLTIAGMLTDLAGRDPKAPTTPIDVGRLAIMAIYQVDRKPGLFAIADELSKRQIESAQRVEGKGAFFWDPEPDLSEAHFGVFRYGWTVFTNGSGIQTLSRWSRFSDNQQLLPLCRELADYAMQPQYWQPEASPKVVVGAERGQFDGHHHSYLRFLKGVLCYAEITRDARLMQFVRDGYEYFRTFGLARIGVFGEGCSTSDMTFLAVKLSDLGVGDYWEDVDQYARNHLVELQITDAQMLHELTPKMTEGRSKRDFATGPFDPTNESRERAIDRSIGAFWSDSTHPTLIPESNMLYTICCTGNCVPALYWVWDGIVRCEDGAAQVNLLLNRSSQWLDVDSYLPYEGKVVIHNKSAKSIAVRIPLWVDWDSVESRIDGNKTEPSRLGQYLLFNDVAPKSELVIAFPMKESVETWTLKWRENDQWKECTNPGPHWALAEEPRKYTMQFRGNTLVDIEPRDTSLGYPLYRRSQYAENKAPMKSTTRFVPAMTIDW